MGVAFHLMPRSGDRALESLHSIATLTRYWRELHGLHAVQIAIDKYVCSLSVNRHKIREQNNTISAQHLRYEDRQGLPPRALHSIASVT